MANLISRPNPTTKPQPCKPACPPVCPDCGGLECLCRPRFFAGQLLTDEDLKLLDHYIVSKNRLHNRYLIGWGVVCGLEVVCNPCDGTVTVKPGYALSRCGDDIVVCADAPVPVCDLIKKCRPQPADCRPFQPGQPDPCQNATEKWILSIHYDEKASRGVVPLKSSACCSKCATTTHTSCGCGCSGTTSKGGSSNGCGCSSGSQKAPTSSFTSTSAYGAAAPMQCEPTVLCEGFRFEVKKQIPPTREDLVQDHNPIVDRFLCCVDALLSLLRQVPSIQQEGDVRSWVCDLRNVLLNFFASNPGFDCTIAAQLAALCPPEGTPINIPQVIADGWYIVAEYIQKCFCSSLLPPCSGPVEDAAVPIAVVTVGKTSTTDCQVQSICNLSARRFAITMPNLGYWLSMFPFVRNLRKLFEQLCCTPLPRPDFKFSNRKAVFEKRAAAVAPATTPGQDLSEVAFQAWSRRGTKPVDARILAGNALGLGDEAGNPLISDLEQGHPFETLLFNQVGVPLTENVLPPQFTRMVTGLFGGAFVAPPAAAVDPETRIRDLGDHLQTLKAELAAHEKQLEELKKQLKKK